MNKSIWTVVWAAASLAAQPVYADQAYQTGAGLEFRSPSGNIRCLGDGDDGSGSINRGVFCSMNGWDEAKPRDCDLDWTPVLRLNPAGAARKTGVCHGDIVHHPEAKILPYGQSVRGQGWQCVSRADGIRCTNGKKRGFHISRSRQAVF